MTQTMGSREIAELCGKSHRHVLRDVEKLNLNYERLSLPKIEQGYYTTPKTGSQQHREFYLTKEQTLDHAEQLLRQAEEARQKVLAELGDLSEFD